jgi:predicted transcriptional regulator
MSVTQPTERRGNYDVRIGGSMSHYIDKSVERVGISKLRQMNAANLGKLDKMLVIQDNDTALAVVVQYERYLAMQDQLEQALRTIQAHGLKEVERGLQDAAAGRVTPLHEVDPTL